MAKQTRDAWVLEVQEWLNETYKSKPGFGSVPEDGKTGWPTIYGLIRALQIELELSPVDNIGEGTKREWDSQVVPSLKEGYDHNIVKLLMVPFVARAWVMVSLIPIIMLVMIVRIIYLGVFRFDETEMYIVGSVGLIFSGLFNRR